MRNPRVLEQLRAALTADDESYLDAVVKETLRIRPVIAGVGRVVRGEPFELGGYMIPPGIEINPSIAGDPPARRPLSGARRVPARALPGRRRSRHLHLAARSAAAPAAAWARASPPSRCAW